MPDNPQPALSSNRTSNLLHNSTSPTPSGKYFTTNNYAYRIVAFAYNTGI
jgi:hypothetical protein